MHDPAPAPDALLQPSDRAARVLHPPSNEQLFWLRLLRGLVAPPDGRGPALVRWWHVAAVAPFAHLTFFSLTYQAYLYDIFHTSKTARFVHQVGMPVVNFMLLAALAPYRIGPIDGALAYALVLGAWYLAQAALERFLLWGAVMAVFLAAMYAGARAYAAHFALPGAPWWAPTPLAANPFLWIWLWPFLQGVSHVAEGRVPPRASWSPRWVPVTDFVLGPPAARHGPGGILRALAGVALQAVTGTLDELWASPRLFPYGILEQMWRHGYAPDRFAVIDRLTREALASGDPAIDYVGIGGGTFLKAPAR